MQLQVIDYIKAGYPLLALQTTEQERALEDIAAQVRKSSLPKGTAIFIWKVTHGLVSLMATNPESEQVTHSLLDSLKYAASGDSGSPFKNRVYVFFNIKDFLRQPDIKQQLRDTAHRLRTVGSSIIVVGGQMDIPEELEDVITPVGYDLPTKEELKASFKEAIEEYNGTLKVAPENIDALADLAADNATGLTALKAENALALSISVKRAVDIDMLRHEKQMAVKQSGVLEYIAHTESVSTLGGFDILKEHVGKRVRFFNDHKAAMEFGLDVPKGILLTGLAGTGKSLAAKAIADMLNLPLYKFDVGSLFKGVVGASEQQTKNAIKLIETVAPCVLLLDGAAA